MRGVDARHRYHRIGAEITNNNQIGIIL